MSEKIPLTLNDVEKTLFLPLWGRAHESRKSNPLLVDEMAVDILDQVDFDFSSMAERMDPLSQFAWIKRSLFFDKVCMEFMLRYPAGTVVNLGCGLDTTFERVDNGLIHWVDLDLPEVIALRSRFIQPDARRKFLAQSILSESWLDEIKVHGNVLFMAAGLLYFLEEDQVRQVLLRLLDRFPGSELICDVSSPQGVRVANQKVMDSAGLSSASYLRWGLKDTRDLLAWDERLRLLKTYTYFKGRVPGLRNKVMGMLSDALKIQYMIHLRLGQRQKK